MEWLHVVNEAKELNIMYHHFIGKDAGTLHFIEKIHLIFHEPHMDPDNNLITDRLSNLPYNVIDQILCLLPLKEAARTSVLSKKWKDTWLTIPDLVFEEDTSELVISHVLRLHKDPIVKFAIDSCVENETTLYDWFNFLSEHSIEELTIMISFLNDHFNLIPNLLFSFYNLKHLSLQHVEVRVRLPLSMYNGFSNLISIKFDEVIIVVEELQRLIDKCPKLESLTLVDCFELNSTFHISTPHSLKSFLFWGLVDILYIYSNPHLEDVSIYSKHRLYTETGTESDYAVEFFDQLSLLKKLLVNGNFLQVLAISLPSKLPKSLIHLEHIQFQYIDFSSVNIIKAVLCLIRSSPNLQSIGIFLPEVCWNCDVGAAIEYLKEEQKSGVPLSSSLKEVKIQYFSEFAPEMEFVKLLFLGAPELRKVEITVICKEQQFTMRETLESFRQSSSQEIILKD